MFRKKLLIVSASILASLCVASATYQDFVGSLGEVGGVDISSFEAAPTVSRNQLAELLNYVDCHDCHRPGKDLIDRLTSSWWNTFRASPAVNFDDISYSSSLERSNNYYCVAYTAEQSYMSGYPRQTSPLCSGKFCGINNTTVADFIQVIINILADRIASHYQVSRQAMEKWLSDDAQTHLRQGYFTLAEQALINNQVAVCKTGNCSLNTADEFGVYLKYCTFNLKACGMQEWQTAQESFWPVAELNVLVLEGIITDQQANSLNVNNYVDGQTVLTSLSQVREKVACTFTNDQDHDGIIDDQDDCYLTYDPSQQDTDKDGLGDVCDDDIDGDTITNPVGVVDDEGNIDGNVVKNYTGTIDNCLWAPNTDQADSNNDTIGDECGNSLYYGLSIVTKKIRNASYALVANYTGALRNFSWDFGDGTYGAGKATSHTFPGEGIYGVVLTAQGGTRTYIATTTIVVGINVQPTIGFQIIPNPLTAQAPATISVTPVTTRPVDSIVRATNGTNKTGTDGQVMSFLYSAGGNYPIIAKAYDGTQIVAYAQGSVSLDGAIGSYLIASNLSPTPGTSVTFSTTTVGIQKKDVASVKWDFGDGTLLTNNLLTLNYTYTKTGPKIVTETIYLIDGTVMTNIININVAPQESNNDKVVDLLPEKLVMNVNELVRYRYILTGITWDNVKLITTDMGDGHTLVFTGALPNGFSYIYIVPGIYRVQSRVQTKDGLRFYPAAHITVIGGALCLQKPPVTTGLGACDMDKDGVADICDTDINGNGKVNMLGLIVPTSFDCLYTGLDLDTTIVDTTIIRIASGDTTLDNCPTTKNANQKDINGNFIGDGCENIITRTDATGGNGIVKTDIATIDPGIEPGQCNVCPCPYVQDAADLKQGDKVRAILLNAAGNQRMSTSFEYIVQ